MQSTLDRVFPPEASQTDVFSVVAPLVASATEGINVTCFAYGQTGTGKTYTMLGQEAPSGAAGASGVTGTSYAGFSLDSPPETW
jgi:hypothetical protein